jgi:AP-1 complex subunit beta-1
MNRELKEIEEDLLSKSTTKKVQAIHKVIQHMNMGKNVSSLFFPVMKCLEIQNAEIKKLVYLYITQYSQEFPQEAIMSVNSFIRDAKDKSNSVVRAMAIRTMGCLRVRDLSEYLVQPLMDALGDDDSYVKKTAVMAVPKLNEISPDIVQNAKLIPRLQAILDSDKNPYVISNTLLALHEIEQQKSPHQQAKVHQADPPVGREGAGRTPRMQRFRNQSGAR